MYKIYIKNNYFYIEEVSSGNLFEGLSKDVRVRRSTAISDVFYFDNVNGFDNRLGISFANIQDESGVAYTDLATFVNFYESNTGKSSPEATGQLTGGAQYVDTQYTSASPYTIPATNPNGTIIPCNNGSIVDGNVPSEFTNGMFFNNKLQAVNNKDRFLTEVRFKAKTSINNDKFDILIDIGSGSLINIRQESFIFTRSANTEQSFARVFKYYTGNTFIANGGSIKVINNGGTISMYDIEILPTRVHRGY